MSQLFQCYIFPSSVGCWSGMSTSTSCHAMPGNHFSPLLRSCCQAPHMRFDSSSYGGFSPWGPHNSLPIVIWPWGPRHSSPHSQQCLCVPDAIGLHFLGVPLNPIDANSSDSSSIYISSEHSVVKIGTHQHIHLVVAWDHLEVNSEWPGRWVPI